MTAEDLDIQTRIDDRSRQWSLDGGRTWLERWSELSRHEKACVAGYISWKLRCTDDRAAEIGKEIMS